MEWREYTAVAEFYGARKAKRSDVPLMQHIDEGLTILQALGATERAHARARSRWWWPWTPRTRS